MTSAASLKPPRAPGADGGPGLATVEFHAAADVPDDLREAWEQARVTSAYPRGQDRVDWLAHIGRYGVRHRPGIAVLRDEEGGLVGGLPFYDEHHRARWRLRLPARAVTAVRFDVETTTVPSEEVIGSDDPSVADRLVHAIIAARRHRGVVLVPEARIGTGLETALSRLGRRPQPGWIRAPFPLDTLRWQSRPGDDFDAFVSSRVSAKARSDLRRRQRRHLEQPGASLSIIDRPEQVERFVEAASQILDASWHGAQGAAMSRRRKDDLRWWAERGELLGWLYEDASGPVAFQISRVVDGTQWFDLIAYRADRGKDSPGEMLMYNSLRVGHERGARLVDWGCGQQPYKERWAGTSLSTRQYTFVRTRLKPLVAAYPPLQYRWARGIAIRQLRDHGLAERLREFSNHNLMR